MDVAAFLARHPPFDRLSAEELEEIAARVRVQSFQAGESILVADAPPDPILVVRSGAVEVLDRGRLLDLAGEGEILDHAPHGGAAPGFRAHEVTVVYLVERAAVAAIPPVGRTSEPPRATAARPEPDTGVLHRRRIDTLIHRPPVTCEVHATVRDAAALMARERVSSLLIPTRGAWGILTDRDLRSRVVAQGRAADTSVEEVMSFPARTVPAGTMAGEVLLLMLEGGFHHFPVIDANGWWAWSATRT